MWMWRLATTGWVVSSAWHAASWMRYPDQWWWVAGPLLMGLAVVWLPAVLRMSSARPLVAGWLQWSVVGMCLAYAFVNVWWLADASKQRPPVVLSGHLMAFYALAAAVLWPSPPMARRASPTR